LAGERGVKNEAKCFEVLWDVARRGDLTVNASAVLSWLVPEERLLPNEAGFGFGTIAQNEANCLKLHCVFVLRLGWGRNSPGCFWFLRNEPGLRIGAGFCETNLDSWPGERAKIFSNTADETSRVAIRSSICSSAMVVPFACFVAWRSEAG